MPSPLDEVLEAFQGLLDARRLAPVPAEAGRGNFRCERCVDCSHCRFCTDCAACDDCTYCEGCSGCSSCTHCKHCTRCKQTTHSSWSSECSESSYLTLCLDCKACVQCFACVGLQNEEFCVLNEKLSRKAYFSRVAALRGALEERMAAGWRPPWDEPIATAEPVVEAGEALEGEVERPALPSAAGPAHGGRIALAELAPPRAELGVTRPEAMVPPRAELGATRPEAMVSPRMELGATRPEAMVPPRAELGVTRPEAMVPPRAELGATRPEAMVSPRAELGATRPEAMVPPRGEVGVTRPEAMVPPRGDAGATRPERSLWAEATRRDDTAPVHEDPRPEPPPRRAELDSRHNKRSDPPWAPPPARMPDFDDRAGRSEITIDVIEDEGPRGRVAGSLPWTFTDARRGRIPPSEPEDELIPDPPPFGSGPHPMARPPGPREEGSVVSRASDEPTRRRDRAAEPPLDRYGWSAQAEGTPVHSGWSADGERGRWSMPERDPSPRPAPAVPEPRTSRWSAAESTGRWGRARDVDDRGPPRKATPTEARPWPPRDDADASAPKPARSSWGTSDHGDSDPRSPRSSSVITEPDEARYGWSPKTGTGTDTGTPRRAWPPKAASEQPEPRALRGPKGGWDEPPGLRRDPHENDFDRRRRETAASPTASELDLDGLPPAYGRDRPFDPEPPLQLDVWSAYEHIQRSRLGPDEQTEPDAPVARRGPARIEPEGAPAVAADDPVRRSETRTTPRIDDDDPPAEPPRSLGAGRRPERPPAPEARERSTGMLRGRAPARPAPPAPARQADAPSLRRARRPSRVRDESTSEYLAVDGPADDAEPS